MALIPNYLMSLTVSLFDYELMGFIKGNTKLSINNLQNFEMNLFLNG